MKPKDAIEKFCEGAVELFVKRQNSLRRGRMPLSKVFNYNETEVHRSLWFVDKDLFLLPIDIDFHDKPLKEALRFALAVAKEIDKRYPKQFLWKFSGRGLHGLTFVNRNFHPTVSDWTHLSDVDVMNAMLAEIGKNLIGVDTSVIHRRAMIRSMGSINLSPDSNLFNIPIELNWSPFKIIYRASEPEIPDWEIPFFESELKDKPQVFKPYKFEGSFENQNLHIDFKEFPPCVKTILSLPNINFEERKILIPYLRDAGWSPERIYNIIAQQYGEEKHEHVMKGREVERFFQANYRIPSCVSIKKLGLCPGFCGRYHPKQPDVSGYEDKLKSEVDGNDR